MKQIILTVLAACLLIGCTTPTLTDLLGSDYETKVQRYRNKLIPYNEQIARRNEKAKSLGFKGYEGINLCRFMHGLHQHKYELGDFIGTVVNGEGVCVSQILDDLVIYRHMNAFMGYGGSFSVMVKRDDEKIYYMNQKIIPSHYVITGIDNYTTKGGGTMTGLLVIEAKLDDELNISKPFKSH